MPNWGALGHTHDVDSIGDARIPGRPYYNNVRATRPLCGTRSSFTLMRLYERVIYSSWQHGLDAMPYPVVFVVRLDQGQRIIGRPPGALTRRR